MSLTTRPNFSNAILNYGPTLPAGPVADGTLFHLTSGATGLYVYNFRQDVTLGTAGDQVGQGWQLLATTGPINADTLDGYDSSAFQFTDPDLTALSNLSGIGFAVRTAPDTWATRSLAAGLGITLSNTNGSVGDITIGVSEGSLNLNNLTGTLSVAKGGTNNTSVVTGGILYGASPTQIGSSAVGTPGQVLLSNGATNPSWTNQSSLSVGFATNASFATTAGTATTATSAGSASTVPWSGVTGTPTTLAGYGITDSVTKTYVDTVDYLNLPPLAGVLRDNVVPVYSDFKFSQGEWNTSTFTLADREGKQVKFYDTSTPVSNNSVFRAYRYSDTDAWIFDNEPVTVGFALATEKVGHILNMGTNFAVLQMFTSALPNTSTRILIATTNGSSDAADWVLLADVTSISASGHAGANYSVVQTTSGTRILVAYRNPTGIAHSVYLDVYNTSLTLLRTLTLHDAATMVNTADTLGQGRVAPPATSIGILGYSGLGTVYPFTWNPFTEKFHLHCSSYYVFNTAGGTAVGQSFGVSISWSIPKSWIESGSGTPTNLIPIKSGSFRYNYLPDSTWGTQTGGMSNTWIGGQNVSLITDEYTGQIIGTTKGSFDSMSTGSTYRYAAGFGYQTFDTTVLAPQQLLPSYGMNIPDGSPWSKLLRSYWGHVIGNQILMRSFSSRYGDRYVQAQFSTSVFGSAATTNDTLKLDSPSAVLDPESTAPLSVLTYWAPGNFGVTVSAGVPTYYHASHGQLVHTITASGSTRTYSSTGLTMPTLPGTISGVTGITTQYVNAWNGSVGSPVFWAVVRSGTGQAYIAKYSGGSWSIPASNLFQAEIDAGKANRGDTVNSIHFDQSGQSLLTESGQFMFGFAVNHTGGTAWFYGSYDTNTNTVISNTPVVVFPAVATSPGYKQAGGYPGGSFGYSTTLGYYWYLATGVYDAAYFASSRDIRTGATITEAQWRTGSATRFQIYITTESATGLVAYISSYPLFIGGYYCTTPTQSIALAASTVNYVYATKNPADRTTVDITTSTTLLPSSFSRVLLAAITTNATNIVSSVSYPVAQEDAVEDLSNVTIVAKQVNDALSWNGTQWVNAPVVRVDETRTGPFAINGALIAGQRDLFTYGVSTASPTLSPSKITTTAGLKAGSSELIDLKVTAGVGYGAVQLVGSNSGRTGWVEFITPAGIQQASIGYSLPDALSTGTGTLNYTAGTHQFQGKILGTGTSASSPAYGFDSSGVSAAGLWYAIGGLDNFVYIGHNGGATFSFSDVGDFVAPGNVTAYSDRRKKKNITQIENALYKVQSIEGVTFDRVDVEGPRQTGVIAQDVQAVLPEAVHELEDGTLTVAYGNMVGLLIEAIKEQQKQIDDLRQTVRTLLDR